MILVSNVLALVGFICLVVAAALVDAAAGFAVAGACAVYVSRLMASA